MTMTGRFVVGATTRELLVDATGVDGRGFGVVRACVLAGATVAIVGVGLVVGVALIVGVGVADELAAAADVCGDEGGLDDWQAVAAPSAHSSAIAAAKDRVTRRLTRRG
jgi:hypothetical protein